MANFNIRIEVKFKSGVLDPQGETIKHALQNLDYPGIESVKTGKLFRVGLDAESAENALQTARELADKLLANTVIEDFEVEIEK
ncbi:MAG: phosphoribosylformylglycinamidine synthase subunit PurS [candidate division Zixibacteria bacterium]|nr:phosphoribosylformylglycinamidine synthase subunit PurS [candidate division Zixibacteria bacterium]